MTNLEDLKRHFKVLYPNGTQKLDKSFHAFLEQNKSSSHEALENNFLVFITKIMRVDLPQSVSFSDSLAELRQTKEKIGHQVDDKKLIPGFITKNILDMPSNRGYIWKNKKYHGRKNPVDGPEVLFEPRKGKTFIHVYEKSYHKVYEKLKGEKTQKLIKTDYIRQLPPPPRQPSVDTQKIEVVEEKKEKKVQKVPIGSNSFQMIALSSDSDSDNE